MSTSPARPSTAERGEGKTGSAHLGRLHLRGFRNFEDEEVEFPPAGVAVVGPNGSGKTNLLEAIYYLDVFRSFRGAGDRELVRFGEDVFRVELELRRSRGPDRSLAAAYQKSGGRKRVERDGREVARLSDAIGELGAVVFSLEDVEIVRGPPARRRRFLNILLSLVVPGYVDALREYRSVLSQRNEALREEEDDALVEAWTEGLVASGARVMRDRAAWIAARAEDFREYHAQVAGEEWARISYEPSIGRSEGTGPGAPGRADRPGADDARADDRDGLNAWKRRFGRALDATRERERRRGMTVVGPHRDEVGFHGPVAGQEERDLRTYGSAGQQRTAALALRLVEADSIRDRLGREPVYLLDDVFAELDGERSRRLMGLLDEGRTGQVVVTSPKPSDMRLREGRLETWSIRDGRIET